MVTDLIDNARFCPSLRQMPRPRRHITLRVEWEQGFSAATHPPKHAGGEDDEMRYTKELGYLKAAVQ